MKIILVLGVAILATNGACGRAQGATDTGSTFAYSSRQQVKCYPKTMADGDTDVQATCASADDLPLSGSCSNLGPRLDATLAVNTPVGWEGSGVAGWECRWVAGGQFASVPNASATICCVVKSP